MAVLLLLERLTPVERAVFVLREGFGYDYEEIATVVGKRAGNCRQIFARANRRVADGRPRFDTSPAERRRLVDELVAASERGDVATLEALLAEDVALYGDGDGGGKAPAFPRPVHGAGRTARLLVSLFAAARRDHRTVEVTWVNQQPDLIVREPDGDPVSVAAFDVDRRVRTIHSVVNPDKLTGISRRWPVTRRRA